MRRRPWGEVTLTATNGTLTLGGTTNLTFTSGTGSGDTTMTFTGTVPYVNAALDGLTFLPGTNYSGPASIEITTNDQGYNGSGIPETADNTLGITVTSDGPVNNLPPPQTTEENTGLVLSAANDNGISITDPGAGTNPIQVTLTATDGTVTLNGTSGLSFSSGASGDSAMTFTGAVSDINNALDGLTFNPASHYVGSGASLEVYSDDQGYNASGTPETADNTLAITVSDGPVNNVPGPQETTENTALVFSTSNSNAISLTDPGAGSNAVQVTLTATNGTLALGSTSGLAFSSGGSGTAAMTFTGTVSNINTALDDLTFTPAADYWGGATVEVFSNDLGNNASGTPETADATVDITVNPAGPVNNLPSPQTTEENTGLVLSAANGNGISILDPAAGSNTIQLTLTATDGTATLSGTTGLTFSSGSGSNDVSMTFSGSVDDINAALDGLTFNPTTNYVGTAAALEVFTDDLGNNASGTPLTADNTLAITVSDGPVNTVPPWQVTNKNTSLTFASGNAIAVTDPGAGSNAIQVTLTATNGTLALSGTSGLTFSSGGSGDSAMTFTGTVADIDAALNGLTFTPTTGYVGLASVEILSDDLGNNASGTPETADNTVDISVNGAPVNAVPGDQSTYENTNLVFSSGNSNAISVAFVDAPSSNPIQETLTATNGTLTLGSTSGLSFSSGTGSGDTTMVFTGTQADINNALAGLTFTPTEYYSGPASVEILTNDLGSNESGVPLTADNLVNINVLWVNQAPAGTSNTVTTLENTPYVFAASDFGFTDPHDSPPNNFYAVEITTLPSGGTLTDNSVAVSAGQFVSVSDISAGDLVYTPATYGSGSPYDSFTFQVQDDGGTANGGVDTDPNPKTMTINVTWVNQAPVGTSNTVTLLENTSYTFSTADFGFTDPHDSPPNNFLAVEITTLPSVGTLTDNGSAVSAGQFISVTDITAGYLRYTPVTYSSGSPYDSFTFQVQDDGGTANGGVDTDPTPRTMTLNVTWVNQAPAGTNNTLDTVEWHVYTLSNADFGFTDPHDSPPNNFLAVEITTLPSAGILSDDWFPIQAGSFVSVADINAGDVRYDPPDGVTWVASTSFTFQVQDDGGTANGGVDTDPTPRTMTINVGWFNQGPRGTDNTVSTTVNTAYTFAAADFGFTDYLNYPAQNFLAVKITTLPTVGTLTDNGVAVTAGQFVSVTDINAGLLVYTPAPDTTGSPYDSFTFQVQGDGGTANGGTDLDPLARTMTIDVV